MVKSKEPTKNPTIEDVQRQFKEWRQRNRPRVRLPQELWEAAVELCRQYTVSYVARILRLDYYKLRDLASRSVAVCNEKKGSEAGPQFVAYEVGAMTMPWSCVLEKETADGDRMRMSVGAGCAVDLVELGKALWRRQR
jgi:hypothetical protein